MRAVARGPHATRGGRGAERSAFQTCESYRDRAYFGAGDELLDDGVDGVFDFVDGAVGDDRAFEEHRDVVGHHVDRLQIVRDDDGGAVEFLAQADDRVGDQVRDDRIEPGRRLVVQHELGAGYDRAREARSLEHAARKVAWHRVIGMSEADALERVFDRFADLRVGAMRVLAQRQRDVLADRQAVEQRRELERERDRFADLVERAFGHMADVVVANVDVSGRSVCAARRASAESSIFRRPRAR